MPWSEHTSKALAAASVQFPDIITALTRAHDNAGPRRLAELQEAQLLLFDVAKAVAVAIEAETKAQPQAAVAAAVRRIRENGENVSYLSRATASARECGND